MKQEKKNRIRRDVRVLFVIYLLALVYFLFFAEGYGRKDFFDREYRYNLVLFQEIRRFWVHRHSVGFLAAFLNLAGNVIGFMPFGFMIPIISRKRKTFPVVVVLGFSFSLGVELIQLLGKVGCFDVDDLLLNTLGAMLGYWIYWICYKIRRLRYGKKKI
ncbi:MAG: VanZ family protein [Fusicatenibacter sp.]|nr:VanZ family protein [Fusicatenibacter sp.]